MVSPVFLSEKYIADFLSSIVEKKSDEIIKFKDEYLILNLSSYCDTKYIPVYVIEMIKDYIRDKTLVDDILNLNSIDVKSLYNFILQRKKELFIISLRFNTKEYEEFISFFINEKNKFIIIFNTYAGKNNVSCIHHNNYTLYTCNILNSDDLYVDLDKYSYYKQKERYNVLSNVLNHHCKSRLLNSEKALTLSELTYDFNKNFIEICTKINIDGIGIDTITFRVHADNLENFDFRLSIDDNGYVDFYTVHDSLILGNYKFKSKEDAINILTSEIENYNLDFDVKCRLLNKFNDLFNKWKEG